MIFCEPETEQIDITFPIMSWGQSILKHLTW